ncbi:hypothetical protein H6G76_34850 [Nostoc sp. FACHB-152]|uniref:hypothetical protein n=1 Tax=unclassified Nostoc TaxID=2593658 RepID=UPI001686BC51|nr:MULTISPECIES: hypothetical protein [unclassified Nostoc]MBD2452193.1 hypothetical protein [Nostoc sp. FACHB-152]MBD2473230.1 hypothetical protein [Nostoc sp. FACHB-145]
MRKKINLVRSSFPPPFLISAFLFSSISIILNPSSASAAICREIQTVINSAIVDNNTAAGGHVTQHIDGLAPPQGRSQAGKTLFADRSKFEAAWRFYQLILNPKACTSGAVQQVVSVEVLKLPVPFEAVKCTGADANGLCTTRESYVAANVVFSFIQVRGEWILTSAYPEPLIP